MRLLRRLHSLLRPTSTAAGPEQVALVAARASVLLRGGVPAMRTLAALQYELPNVPELARIAADVRSGARPASALAAGPGPEWRVLAVAWKLAEVSGAPLAPALDHLAESLRALTALQQRRSILLAGPRATVRLVAMLPVLAVLLGTLMGFDPMSVLLTPGGLMLLAIGSLLLSLGVTWARSMTARLERTDGVAGLEFTLCWVALGGGASARTALGRLADCVDHAHAEWVPFVTLRRDRPLAETIASAAELGAPIGSLLLEEAASRRADAHTALERAAEKLGVKVLIPLGVCALPAFIIVGVLPVVFAMLTPVIG